MNVLVIAAQLIVALGIYNVWLVRTGKATNWRGGDATSLAGEFAVYGLPRWFMWVVGGLKLTFATLLVAGIWLPWLVAPAALGLAALMAGAVVMHLKVGDPLKRALPAAVVLTLCVFVALAATGRELLAHIEEPSHRVLHRDGPFEVREYDPIVAAEVVVPGDDRTKAAYAAFRMLFDYISGENRTRTPNEMEAPVTTSRPEDEGVDIAMTAPVTQAREPQGWRVRFFLPRTYTLETAPAPLNPEVHVVTVPARRVVAMQFSGRASEGAVDARLADLREYVRSEGLAPIGEPVFAQYNSPFVLPFLRRNELLWELPPL